RAVLPWRAGRHHPSGARPGPGGGPHAGGGRRRRHRTAIRTSGGRDRPPRAACSMSDPLRVLVVDDEDDVRLLLRLQLETYGHSVTGEAADGQAALDLCRADPPDAVILDLLMPRMNGFEVIP